MTVAAEPSLHRKLEAHGPPPVPTDIEPVVDLFTAGLTKSYPQRGTVLQDVDLSIGHGQAVALIGANGSGKSTLLRCCLRLVEPDAGTVELLGESVTALSRKGLRRLRAQVGLVFQRHNLIPRLSVLTNVIHGAFARTWTPRIWFQGLAPRAIREEAMHCLDEVGLAHLAQSRADALSGGESQRVAIARALMQRPRIMMADEPVASLDPKVGEEVMDLFYSLIHREDLTLVYVSHDLEHALGYSDRVVGLQAGRVVLNAPSRGLEKEALRSIYD